MPNYVSVLGEWKPAQEFYINPTAKRGENPVYDGPDRAALDYMKENGHVDEDGKPTSFGEPYNALEENIIKAREMGYKSVDEYLIARNKDPKKLREMQEKKLGVIVEHKNPEKKPAGVFESGGDDMSGSGKGRKGGFGEPADAPSARLPKA